MVSNKAMSMASRAAGLFRGDEFNAVRFTVIVDGIYFAQFSEFQLPSLQVNTTEVVEGGQNSYTHKLPVRVTTGNAKLRHGLSSELHLLRWYEEILNGDIQAARRQVTVVLFNVSRELVIAWNFRDAYPVSWTGPTLKTDTSELAFEEIEFVHHGFEFETL